MYLRDMIVFSRTVGDHIPHLQSVLLVMEEVGVSLQHSKWHLLQNVLEYLGHVVRPGQQLVNQKNIKNLSQGLLPRNQRELTILLGMSDMYRRMIKD